MKQTHFEHVLRLRRGEGRVTMGNIVFVVVVGVVASFIDWESALSRLSFGTPADVALSSLNCSAESGSPGYVTVRTSGSVINISEEALKLSVRSDYTTGSGRMIAGKRTIHPVRPNPLAQGKSGTFSLTETIQYYSPDHELGCLIQFYENDVQKPVRFEDRT